MTAVSKYYDQLGPTERGAAVLILSTLGYVAKCLETEAPTTATATPATPPANVSDDKLARLRAKLVADVWEPDLRSDLIDRIVEAYRLGWTDAKTLQAVVAKATKAKTLFETSEGQRGKDSNWKTLSTWCKGVFERNGKKWKPTSSALEPRPRQPRVAPEELAEVANESEGRFVDTKEGRVQLGSLKQLLDGYRNSIGREIPT